ncbi:unnamed protein product [Blepharisma stoltei]|uniref:Uncharacterized protein n=1 Tax=Blepharisma stoltei TaxID=1481888 RepID=A0AAU9IRX9_9CILI|nr:unnamed protein product [Blepharisma stoltei]
MEKEYNQQQKYREWLEQSHRFASTVAGILIECQEQSRRFNEDMNKLFEDGKEDFNIINSDARKSANKIFEECYRKEQEEKEKIEREYQLKCEEIKAGRAKFRVENIEKAFQIAKISAFSKIKERLRSLPKISKSCKTNRIPRPLWSIIIEYCDPASRCKLEKVCRLLFHLANEICPACTLSIGSEICCNFWKSQSIIRRIDIKYEDANCMYIKRVVLQNIEINVFERNLYFIRKNTCDRDLHFWEPKNDDKKYIVCRYCRKGAQIKEICGAQCRSHGELCITKGSKFPACNNHKCICCIASPEIASAFRTMDAIYLDCRKVVINKGGKKNLNELEFKVKLA